MTHSSGWESWTASSGTSRSTFDVARKKTRLEELKNASAAPGFWDDSNTAQKTMAELSKLSEDVSTYEKFEQRTSDAHVLWELAHSEDDADVMAEAEREIAAEPIRRTGRR